MTTGEIPRKIPSFSKVHFIFGKTVHLDDGFFGLLHNITGSVDETSVPRSKNFCLFPNGKCFSFSFLLLLLLLFPTIRTIIKGFLLEENGDPKTRPSFSCGLRLRELGSR